MKEKFLFFKFNQKNFLYTFELNYDDLFKEKGDKIYFLIWFSTSKKTAWEIGYPFIKKYLFTYNYDNKLVSFYNNMKDIKDKGFYICLKYHSKNIIEIFNFSYIIYIITNIITNSKNNF